MNPSHSNETAEGPRTRVNFFRFKEIKILSQRMKLVEIPAQ